MSKKKVYKDVKSFTVKRSDWGRGNTGLNSVLYNTDNGKLCCLGFYALSCGLRKQDIKDASSPSYLVNNTYKLWETKLVRDTTINPRYLNSVDVFACENLMRTNDSELLSDKQRETQLTKQFAKLGIKVKFIP
jgi:hypothetical protein